MELYNNYNQHLRDIFGARIQKISINAGFTCPNRDGTKGVGGCIFAIMYLSVRNIVCRQKM